MQAPAPSACPRRRACPESGRSSTRLPRDQRARHRVVTRERARRTRAGGAISRSGRPMTIERRRSASPCRSGVTMRLPTIVLRAERGAERAQARIATRGHQRGARRDASAPECRGPGTPRRRTRTSCAACVMMTSRIGRRVTLSTAAMIASPCRNDTPLSTTTTPRGPTTNATLAMRPRFAGRDVAVTARG